MNAFIKAKIEFQKPNHPTIHNIKIGLTKLTFALSRQKKGKFHCHMQQNPLGQFGIE